MSNYSSLKATINANIKQNGNEEITGPILNSVLNAMVDSLAGYHYSGIATPATNPGTPDSNVFYIASDAGTYTNFGGLTVAEGEVAILKYNGTWTKEVTGAATASEVSQLAQKIDEFAQGKFYGYFGDADELPAGDISGFAYVGTEPPFAIYNFDGDNWSDSGLTIDEIPAGNGEDIDFNSLGRLQFANREYDSDNPNGMGYVILRKEKTFAEQVTEENTIYEIRYDFDLNGASVTIPSMCVLNFTGGSLTNGTLIGDNTSVIAPDYEIFKRGIAKFHGYYGNSFFNFGYSSSYTGLILSGTWKNKHVSPAWNSLLSVGTSECSFAVNNHIRLYGNGEKVVLPKATFYIYGTIFVSRAIDFNNAKFINIADFSSVEDLTIPIPSGVTSTPLRSLYGLFQINVNNATIENLTIDCNSSARSESYATFGSLGVACAVSLSSNYGFRLKNISISNCPECGICAGEIYDCVFEQVKINNVGEHCIYHHAIQGTLSFIDCEFSDWSNEDSIIAQRGASAAVKFTGLASDFVAGFNAYFSGTSFVCSNNKTRALFYSEMPPKMVFKNCVFGKNIGMFNSEGNYAGTEQKQNVMVFDSCDGVPTANKNNTKNLDIYMYNCKNALFSFQSLYYAENCEFLLSYRDTGTTNVDSGIDISAPVVIRNCTFKDVDTTSNIRETHTLARTNVRFENCSIEHLGNYDNRNVPLWNLSGVTKIEVINSTLYIKYSQTFNVSGCELFFSNTLFVALSFSYAFITGTNNVVKGLNCTLKCLDSNSVGAPLAYYSAVDSWLVLGMQSDKLNHYEREWEANLADGESTIIPDYRYFHIGVPKTIDLTPYIEIVPVSNFIPFTFSVTNNGGDSNSIVTINNGSATKIKYRFKLNFTKKPL